MNHLILLSYFCCRLDKESINLCISKINELKRLSSKIRICALFIDENCKNYDRQNLYLNREPINQVQKKSLKMKTILEAVKDRIVQVIRENIKRSASINLEKSDDKEIGLFKNLAIVS